MAGHKLIIIGEIFLPVDHLHMCRLKILLTFFSTNKIMYEKGSHLSLSLRLKPAVTWALMASPIVDINCWLWFLLRIASTYVGKIINVRDCKIWLEIIKAKPSPAAPHTPLYRERSWKPACQSLDLASVISCWQAFFCRWDIPCCLISALWWCIQRKTLYKYFH